MLGVYTIHDSAAEAFMRPFFAQSSGAAIRSFSDLVNGTERDHPVAAHPEDYTLFEIGQFNERTGQLVSCEPRSLGNGITFLVLTPQPQTGDQLPLPKAAEVADA